MFCPFTGGNPGSNNVIIAVAVCTCILIVTMIIIAVVFFTKLRKSLLSGVNNSVPQVENKGDNTHTYENSAAMFESGADSSRNDDSPNYENAEMIGTGLYATPGTVSHEDITPSIYETLQ